MISSFRQKLQANTDWAMSEPVDAVPIRPERTRKRRPASNQVTAHRLFPVLAALWFAALFGLGSLAISSQVLGVLVTAIGLPILVPAATPPLGFTAHLLVALLLTIVGGALGLVIGLRLHSRTAAPARMRDVDQVVAETAENDAPKVRARDAHPDAPPRRPLVLTEAFGETAEPAISEDAIPLLARKPERTQLEAAELATDLLLPVHTPGGEAALPPLDLSLDLIDADAAFETAPFVEPDLYEPAAAGVPESEPATPSGLQAERPTLLAATPQIPSGFTLPLPPREQILAGEPWSPVATASLDSLGLVQLIERLALAIAARKSASDAGPPPPADAAGSDPAEAGTDEVPGPFAKPAIAPPTTPTAIDLSLSLGTPDHDEPVGSARAAIMRRLGAVAAQASTDPASAPFSRPAQSEAVVPLRQVEREIASLPATQSAAQSAAQSLADLAARPFAAPAVQAPTASAPPAPPAPLETDEALRSALATLQRMSARG
ncbi:MAG: hypothetical protein ACKVOL_13515 [Novosphingobium sp.]